MSEKHAIRSLLMSDEDAIRRTIAQYCHLCDDGRFDEWADLYTDDATFSVMGTTYTGRADVQEFIERGRPPDKRGEHICFNSVIDVDDDGRSASGSYYGIHLISNRCMTTSGRIHVLLTRCND